MEKEQTVGSALNSSVEIYIFLVWLFFSAMEKSHIFKTFLLFLQICLSFPWIHEWYKAARTVNSSHSLAAQWEWKAAEVIRILHLKNNTIVWTFQVLFNQESPGLLREPLLWNNYLGVITAYWVCSEDMESGECCGDLLKATPGDSAISKKTHLFWHPELTPECLRCRSPTNQFMEIYPFSFS